MNTVSVRAAGLALAAARDWHRATSHLRRAVADDPEDAVAQAMLAVCLVNAGRPVEAVAAARRAVALAPELSLAHRALGWALLVNNSLDAAESAAREALRLHVEPNGFVLRGRIRAARLAWHEALADADEAIKLAPWSAVAIELRAAALTYTGRSIEAERVLLDALSREPDNASLHAERGWALMHQGRRADALASFRAALAIDPHCERARNGFAVSVSARNPLYRVAWRTTMLVNSNRFAPSAIGATALLLILIEGLLRLQHPDRWTPVTPLVLAVALLLGAAWLAMLVSNVLLVFDTMGRNATRKRHLAVSSLVGACVVLAMATAATYLVTSKLLWLGIAATSLVMIAPIDAANRALGTPAWRPWLFSAVALGVASAGALVAWWPDLGVRVGLLLLFIVIAGYAIVADLRTNRRHIDG